MSVYARRRLLVGAVAAVVLAALVYTGLAAVRPLPAAQAVVPASVADIVPAAVAPAWPATGSAAVALVGRDGLLGSHGSDAPVPIASMTKTITALVLLQQHPITGSAGGPVITFTDADVAILHGVWDEHGSWASVAAGEQLTLRQALTAMLLPSANNYARSLAVWSSGSQSAFVTAANAWLKKHGFTRTRMTDPSGFDPGSVSTMSELVRIGELVAANPVLAQITGTAQATLPVMGTIDNTNKLIGHDGVAGIKTGFTDQAGHCLLFEATIDVWGTTRTLVGVMMGQPDYTDLWSGVPKLVDSYAAAFHTVDLTGGGTTVYGSYTTAWGARTSVVAATKPAARVYSNARIAVTARPAALADVRRGADAGTVRFRSGGTTTTVRLVTTKAMADPGLWWRLTHPGAMY